MTRRRAAASGIDISTYNDALSPHARGRSGAIAARMPTFIAIASAQVDCPRRRRSPDFRHIEDERQM